MNHVNCTGWKIKDFLRFTQLADILEPDRIMSVKSTRVAKNQILATLHMKYTDSQLLYECVAGAKKSPGQRAECCSADRTERLLLHQNTTPLSAHEKKQLNYFAKTYQDLVVHATVDMTLTFDKDSDKIVAMEFSGRLTSAKPAVKEGRVCTF